jgi:sulfoxide reductase catalytic subunit YedY
MLIRRRPDISPSDITPKQIYLERRHFLRELLAAGTVTAVPGLVPSPALALPASGKLADVGKSGFTTIEKLTPYKDVTTYNNFYEFGTDKGDPARRARDFKTRPWTVAVEGACRRPAIYQLDDFVRPHALEERIYRLRCVEAWSMVIPWVGFPLAEIIKRAEPNSNAKFVEFTTLHDPQQMPGQRPGLFGAGLDWPYVEGLRLDEAMHPLTILAVGLYGEVLPNQNGAPLRLVVPWKYGFKSIKSIVRIRFVEQAPLTTWMKAAPREYGFYSNVNPTVDHPRWSQARERRIGEDGLFSGKRATPMFNGYAEQVAQLYAGMDLRKYF